MFETNISLTISLTLITSLSVVSIILYYAILKLSKTVEARKTILIITGIYFFGGLLGSLLLAINNMYLTTPDQIIPPVAIAMIIPQIMGLVILRWSPFLNLIKKSKLSFLIAIQIYRVLGILFIIVALRGLLAPEFAWSAGIGDIVVGLFAPIVSYSIAKNKKYARKFAYIWNIFGIADLLIAGILGFGTIDGNTKFIDTNVVSTNLIQFPLVLVPVFGVPLAILLHIYSLYLLNKFKELNK